MESLVFLIIMFLVGGVLQTLAQKKQQQRRDARRQRRVTPTAHTSADDPVDLLDALRRAYEQAQHEEARSRRPQMPAPRDESLEEMIEETASLEVEPEVRSVEVIPNRRAREIVDQDDAAEAVIAQRLKWAEDHAKPLSPADHRAFDQQIRAAPPAPPGPTALSGDRTAALRQMVVWQEVLGKPKALR
jgi:hypothetical protein